MFSGVVLCLTFLLWGCITQVYQTSPIQGHDEDKNRDTTARAINGGAPLGTEKEKFSETITTMSEIKMEDVEECEPLPRIKRHTKVSEICSLPKVSGPCMANLRRYYYDSQHGNCEPFIYGGCEGNTNNFRTVEDCSHEQFPEKTTTISEVTTKDAEHYKTLIRMKRKTKGVCSLPKDSGLCLARVHRFYYDSKHGNCEPFIYGGCNGNGNNFKTMSDCSHTCK